MAEKHRCPAGCGAVKIEVTSAPEAIGGYCHCGCLPFLVGRAGKRLHPGSLENVKVTKVRVHRSLKKTEKTIGNSVRNARWSYHDRPSDLRADRRLCATVPSVAWPGVHVNYAITVPSHEGRPAKTQDFPAGWGLRRSGAGMELLTQLMELVGYRSAESDLLAQC